MIAAVAVAAAAAAILSITVVRVVESGSDVTSVTATEAAKPIAVKMMSASDIPAGWAYVTNRHSVAIALNYGMETGRYRIAVQPRTGSTVTIGTMAIENDRGSWTGTSRVALGEGSTIFLVDADGSPSCHGTIA